MRVRKDRLLPWKLFLRLTIAGKMFAGYMVLAVLILTVVVYVLVSLYQINSLNRDIVTVDIPVQVTVDKMIDVLLIQDVFAKRYLILRRKDLRYLFWERAKEFDVLLKELRNLRGNVPLPLARIDKLHTQYGDRFLDVIRKVKAGKTESAEAISNGPMRNHMDGMLDLLKHAPQRAKAVQDARMKEIGEASERAIRTTILLCVVSTAVGALAGLLVTYYISSSLGKLKAATNHIAEGAFDAGPRMRAKDEIGDLARAFETMGRRLKKLEEMYLDASPLTRLPGGIAIEREVQRRIDLREPMAFCVMDIDNFKAFNDRYGYAHGNEVIKETARIVEQASRTNGAPGDFVGHIGGDDFVVVTKPEKMHGLCTEIIELFDRRIPTFYQPGDRQRGYIWGKSRQGVEMKFPLMTVSIAIVTNTQRTFASALEASEVAAELKDYAKTFSRSLYVVDKRRA